MPTQKPVQTLLPVLALAVGVGATMLTGCGAIKPGSSNPTPGTWTPPSSTPSSTSAGSPGAPSTPTSVQVNTDNSTNIGYYGQTATVACESGKTLNIGGANNTLTITGTCDKVSVTGYSNTVTFEEITTGITVTGYGNKLTYKSGEPKVDNIGANNSIEKAS